MSAGTSAPRSASATASATSPAPIPRGAVLTLSLAAFLSAISLRMTDALLPLFAREFGISLGRAAGAITAFSVAYGLSQLFFGPVGDRFGKYRVIGMACIACTLTSSACALTEGFVQLEFARLLAGATAAAIIPLSMAWLGDVVPYEDRQPVLARFLIGQILGVSAGVLVGGFAADHLGWRLPFLGIGAGFAIISIALLAIDRRLPAHARGTTRIEGHALRRVVGEFSQVIALPWARVVLLTVFAEGAFLYGGFAFIASHLHTRFGMPLATAGSTLMLFGFGGLLFAIAAAALVRRLGEVGLTRYGGLLITLSYLTIGLAPHWAWAPPACFVAGLGFYMLHNTLQINATQMAPERRGAAVAAFASCFFLGQAAGVAMNGVLVGLIGTRGVLCLGAVGVLLVSTNFSRLRSHRDAGAASR